MQLQEQYHTTEVNNAFFNQYLASAPPQEIEQDNREQEATGGTAKVKEEPNLPINSEEKIPGAKDDQNIWTSPTMPQLKKVDTSKHMIIVYKSDISKNKQPLKQLAKEYLEEMGLGNLTYPTQSQENAGGVRPEEIWGYLLRYDQEEGAQQEKKTVTYAAWIKKDVKDKWLDKAYDTVNLTNDLRMTLLTNDINKNPVFNDIKHHFAIWEENVMIYLYTVLQKRKQKQQKKEKPKSTSTITKVDLQRDVETIRAQETQRLDQNEKTIKAKAAKAKLEKEIEEKQKIKAMEEIEIEKQREVKAMEAIEIEKQRKVKEDILKDVATMAEALKIMKIQSARASVQPSRRQSRATSPTHSTLKESQNKLKIELIQRKLKAKQDRAVAKIEAKIKDLETKKNTTNEIQTPENNGSSSSSHTDDSDSDSTASEVENKDFDTLTENTYKMTEKQKKEHYELQMELKKAKCPGQFVCPEAECKTSNPKEKKLANHIIADHGNTEYAQQAKEDLLRIKSEKEGKRKHRADDKKKREENKGEAKYKKKWMT